MTHGAARRLAWSLAGLTFALYAVIFPLFVLVKRAPAASLVSRFRRSDGEERQQIKWIAFSAGIIGVVYLIAIQNTPECGSKEGNS